MFENINMCFSKKPIKSYSPIMQPLNDILFNSGENMFRKLVLTSELCKQSTHFFTELLA